MKAVLTFDLNDEGDRSLHELALQSPKMHAALVELRELLRKKRKYEDNEEASKIEDEFFRILNDYGVTLD